MRRSGLTNVPASIHQRLLNWSVAHREDMNLVMTRFALERLLYRLGQSPFRAEFILKGAMLFALWTPRSYRATRDLDLLGYGENSAERLTEVFRSLCGADRPEDGLSFEAETIQVSSVREDQEYEGKRVEMTVRLGRSRIRAQIDIGFGDVIVPAAMDVEYPTLLGLPAPRVRAYPRETVVAEKLSAVVSIGVQNSRKKDFYDLAMLADAFAFDGAILAGAVKATFARRGTLLSERLPVGLSDEFSAMPAKRLQWAAFIRRGHLPLVEGDFGDVVRRVRAFLWPVLETVAVGRDFDRSWPPAGPWR
jgi:predicted nucleotidyltransferase component of viral defense system